MIDYDAVFADNIPFDGTPKAYGSVQEMSAELDVMFDGDDDGIDEGVVPAVIDVFDLGVAKERLAADGLADLERKAASLVVETDEGARIGLGMAMQARKMSNAIEKARKEIVRPHLDFQKAVKEFADTFTKSLKKIEADAAGKVEAYQAQKEAAGRRIREEAERKEREEQERRAKELREYEAAIRRREAELARATAEAEKANMPPPPPPPPLPPPKPTEESMTIQTVTPIEPPKKIETEDGTSTTVVQWVYDVEDEGLVPREYLTVDEKKVKEAVAAGVRNISGVKIYEKTIRKYRVKR